MGVTHEYGEYYLSFNRSHYIVFQGCKAVFVQKLITNIKKIYINRKCCKATGCIWPPAIFLVVPCAISAMPPNCTVTSRLHTPLDTAV